MILKIKQWCEGIIIAIIISIIIEMLVPEGNNKKYVKVVIGIYIMFVTLNPLLNLLNFQFDLDSIFNIETKQVYSNLDSNIKDVYVTGIEETIKSDLEDLGYNVKNVCVYVDINYENIEKIELELSEKNNEIKIEPIIIDNSNNLYSFDNSSNTSNNENDLDKTNNEVKENYSDSKNLNKTNDEFKQSHMDILNYFKDNYFLDEDKIIFY